jgi:hypothetical protein
MLLGSAVWLQSADWPNWRGPGETYRDDAINPK